jgi:chloramphenicol O-acetyltransferase type B
MLKILRRVKHRLFPPKTEFRNREIEYFIICTDKKRTYTIGRGSYGEPEILDWDDGTSLHIGNFCSISADVKIFLGGDHRPDWVTMFPFPAFWTDIPSDTACRRTKGNVIIEHDVWIGRSATILSGVTLGTGCVIGANAVVSKDIPPYAIAVGNPAKIVRKRFSDDVIARLLETRWWEWPDEMLRKAMPLLLSSDLEGFLEFASDQARRPSGLPA